MESRSDTAFEQLKRDRQADLFRTQLVAAGLGNVFNGTLLAAVFYGTAPAALVVGWWAITMLIAARTTYMGLRQRRRTRQGGTTPKIIQRIEIATWITGAVWGVGAATFFPYGSLPEQLLLAFVVAGTAAGAAAGLSTLPRASTGFHLAILSPVVAWFLILGGDLRWVMAAMTITFFVVLCLISRTAYRAFLQATQVQLDATQQSALLETTARIQSSFIAEHDADAAFADLLDDTINETDATIAILAEFPDGGGNLPVLAARTSAQQDGTQEALHDLPVQELPYTGPIAKALGGRDRGNATESDTLNLEGVGSIANLITVPITGPAGPMGLILLAAPDATAPPNLTDQRRATLHAVAANILFAQIEQRDRRAEQSAFTELAEQNRITLENVEEGIFAVDADGHVIQHNDSAARLFGSPDLIDRSMRDLVPQWQSDDPLDLEQADTGQRTDGSAFPVLISANRANDRGSLVFVITVKDLTARQNLQVELERFFSASIDLFFVADMQGYFRYNNAAWTRLLGIERKALLAHPFIDFVHPDDHESTMAEYGKLAAGNYEVIAFENRFLDSDGESRWFVWNVSVNEPMGRIYGVGRDVTEQRKLEEMKGNFISLVSHELRTPLTSINASLGLLDDETLEIDATETGELISIARKNSDRLIRLVNDILDLQKLDSATPNELEGSCQLGATVSEALDQMRGYAQEKGVTLELEQQGGYDPTVPVHEDRIIQIMTNLTSNAVKYTPADGVVTCRVEPSPTNGLARLSVEDQGPGVPAEFRAQLFTRFSRAATEENRTLTGTGLGLSICKTIVDAAGGEITYASAPDKGATFICDLPVSSDV